MCVGGCAPCVLCPWFACWWIFFCVFVDLFWPKLASACLSGKVCLPLQHMLCVHTVGCLTLAGWSQVKAGCRCMYVPVCSCLFVSVRACVFVCFTVSFPLDCGWLAGCASTGGSWQVVWFFCCGFQPGRPNSSSEQVWRQLQGLLAHTCCTPRGSWARPGVP